MKRRADKKVSCVSKKITTKITNYKIYKKLSKDKEIDICLDALLEMSFQELILISSSQIN